MKRFTLSESISGRSWQNIDQADLWKQIKEGLDTAAAGVNEAVQEIYGLLRGEVGPSLTQESCLLPHHEVSSAGKVTLNKAGLITATAALASSDLELTDQEREVVRQHLLKHYSQMELEPPASLSGEVDETMSTRINLEARLSGEMKPSDIPLAQGVDLDAIKDGDADPLEVVVEIPPGKSTRNWNYTGEALQQIVEHVDKETLSGFLGHQKAEEVSNEFPTPVTHWVGAAWKDNKAYFRGVVDKAATDLKRWIKSKRVKQVSIFGAPTLKKVNGETLVVGYKPMSIDWTPLNRAGMPTKIVAVGEMDSTFGELDGSYEDLHNDLRKALGKKYPDRSVYIERMYLDHVIAAVSKSEYSRKLLSIPYTVNNGQVNFGEATEVELEIRRDYVPAGEMDGSYDELLALVEQAVRAAYNGGEDPNRVWAYVRRLFPDYAIVIVHSDKAGQEQLYKVPWKLEDEVVTLGEGVQVEEKREYIAVSGEQGGIDMTLQEMLAAIKAALAGGEQKLLDVLGEIGVTADQALDTLAGEQISAAQKGADLAKSLLEAMGLTEENAVATAGEMAAVWKALGFDTAKPEKPAEVAGEMIKAQAEIVKAAHQKLVSDTIQEKVTGEQAQALVARLIQAPEGATKEQIVGEIDTVLGDEAIKGILGKAFIDKPAGKGSGAQEPQRQHTQVKRVGI